MSNNSRENILSAIRNNLPKLKVEHPQIPPFEPPVGPLKAAFEEHLKKAGGMLTILEVRRKPRSD